jgi:GTP pyrophosphokinase
VAKAGGYLAKELEALGIHAEISGRAKHFYSIYSKMTKKGREFNEIYDLTAMRVIVDSVKDCYGAVGVIHSLWKPLPGRFKDMVAMPKFNMYQALHTTVIGPEGRPLEIQIRTNDMHETAEYGVAAHWRYKEGSTQARLDPTDAKLKWLKSLLDWQRDSDSDDPSEFTDQLRGELIEEEVFVFTPKGEVKSLAAGATPLDFAYEIHTDVGHRCVGARVNGKIVPLHYELQSGDIVEILTSKRERGPSRDWLSLVKTTRARNKIKAWFKAESREDSEHTGRELLQEHLHKAGLPAQKLTGSPLLADVIREMGFRKADDFYIALGAAKVSPKVVVNKVLQRLKQGEAGVEEPTPGEDLLLDRRKAPAMRRPDGTSGKFGIVVEGVNDVPLRLAKCCRPVSGDPIVGYVSLGRGITIHRDDCPNVAALRKDPDRFVPVSWDGDNETGFKVEIQVDAWDRHRLLEDLSRTFAEAGINIVEARCLVQHPMTRNRFVIEVGDTQALKAAISRLRSIDSVFDAYRVIPSGS